MDENAVTYSKAPGKKFGMSYFSVNLLPYK